MKLIGVGMGPGDPEMVTVGALRALRGADRVFAPSVAIDVVGRAESIARQACPDVAVERLVVEMGAAEAWFAAAADRLAACLDATERVAVMTLGDPNVYSTFSSLATAVRQRRPATTVETVPGITAFQDLAARAGVVLLEGTGRLCLVTALDGADALDHALADPDAAVVVYKGGRHLPAVVKRLAEAGRLQGAVMGELLGLPGQRVVPASEAADGPAAYLATVIVPPRPRRSRGERPLESPTRQHGPTE